MTPWYTHWFSFSIRRERKSFILASLAMFGLFFLALVIIRWLDLRSGGGPITFVYFALALFGSYTLTAQRLRDINVTGWLALLWIPIAMTEGQINKALFFTFWLVLITVPGSDGANRYGNRLADQEPEG